MEGRYGDTRPSSLFFQQSLETWPASGIVHVLSGKGGVGKSTISTELALALRHGQKVSASCLVSPLSWVGTQERHLARGPHERVDAPCAGGDPGRGPVRPQASPHAPGGGRGGAPGRQWLGAVFVDREQSISLMSVGFLLEQPDEAVVWRGPRRMVMPRQAAGSHRPATPRCWGKTGAGLHFQTLPPTLAR